ncbi:class I SAM-dependent methyltransferase [Nitratireductor kimnyeongensis]|uniref:Class I SAM-dependent methyltransferase n=1 Tax=Nitratireductor kimnyeongensis TaxID=430679 RepID=A0ABW0T8Q2_9HYPH|nr:class I SAM-dependent methyltransferase [Nitratireductor kimnyeongensis]QZZ35945.1 class I SAM-dependent methyltransferase [Nitratireductor kimnyeongensis]
MAMPQAAGHASLMDGVYRRQRHIYDLTRKYYLLGRDGLIGGLNVPEGGAVLELGCGTGRNLALVSDHFPKARLFGLDISREMLSTARRRMERENIDARLAEADASSFDAEALFGQARFERVFISYALSMIPPWRETIAAGLDCVAPGGSLHIVDFGRQERLPGWFRSGLRRWLLAFHVIPRDSLREALESECEKRGASLRFDSSFRGYAVRAIVELPAVNDTRLQ